MKLRYTISGKLLLLFVLITVLLVALVGSTIGHSFRNHFAAEIHPHLTNYLEYIRQDLGTPPQLQSAARLAQKHNLEITFIADSHSWSTHGLQLPLEQIEYSRAFTQNGIRYRFGELGDRQVLIGELESGTLIFSVPRQRRTMLERLRLPLGVLLLLLLLLYYATRRLFRPIETIRQGVLRFGAGDLEQRITINRRDELGELATSFNAMADKIQQMLEAKRQLLLAISHELRTPLTRAKLSLELIDDVHQREELNHDLMEMEQLITELLETERLASSHRTLDRQPCRLDTLITELLQERFDNQSITLQMTTASAPELHLDTTRIKLLLKNLLENALRHTAPDDAPPQLSLELTRKSVLLRIRDFGEGIEKQHLEHLTEPFYRVDSARQRQTGGYGLGLYLCRVIAEAHGGTLRIESTVGEGSVITVTLPPPEEDTIR